MAVRERDGEDWKNRYLEALRTVEVHEERLAAAEDLIRLALGRLTLAAEKAYPPLESSLAALRQTVKAAPEGQLPLTRLLTQLQEVVNELRTLEARSERSESAAVGPQAESVSELDERAGLARRFLAVLLEKLVLTHELEQRKSELLEALGLAAGEPTMVLIDRAATLVRHASPA